STSSRPADPVNPVRYRTLTRWVTSRAPHPTSAIRGRSRARRPATSGSVIRTDCTIGSEESGHGVDGQDVAVAPESGDQAVGDGRHDGGVAPRLTGVGIREMELDHRSLEGGQRV